ncbi:GNAT family N-acetyltransferase [Nonomuraea sp. NPDC050153]|uniref:GNAT family N-acetyltransferase n=1 Tax=Nonomuraea sp. NPDC050153 TaxID=3364359 RepID=UPI0037A5499F
MPQSALGRARDLWAGLARVPVAFPASGDVTVVVSPGSSLCPPGWTGVVALDGAILATVPAAGLVEPVRSALLGLGAADLARLPAHLPALDVLGPATLAYLDTADFTRHHLPAPDIPGPTTPGHLAAAPVTAGVERLPVDHPAIRALLSSVPEEEAAESGLEEIGSAAYAVREGGDAIAAAGFRPWLDTAAHVSVLTAPRYRGRGLARLAASAAVADALATGLLPQWRARPEPSRRVARALGFREYGAQISLRLQPQASAAPR